MSTWLLFCAAPPPAVQAATSPYAIRVLTTQPILRLYRHGTLVHSYPIALGRSQTSTPIGTWQIVNKQRDWGRGFGTRWLGLNVPWGIYGIHGTNRPTSIGQYASSGCIRMHNADVESLYELVPVGTLVIVDGNPLAHVRKLEYGNIGADVRLVQKALKDRGFYHGTCDGKFDSATLAAALHFQLAHQLMVDGRITIDDYRALHLLGGTRSPAGVARRA